MPNLAQALKEEIIRLASKVSRQHSSKLKVDIVRLKKSNVAMRKIIAQLQRDNELLLNAEKRRQQSPLNAPVIAPQKNTARITARGVKAMRKKLGLSQDAFAKLVGVSDVCIYNLEKKSGALRLRNSTRAALLALRGIGAREAKRRLELVEGKKAEKRPVRKTKKLGKKTMYLRAVDKAFKYMERKMAGRKSNGQAAKVKAKSGRGKRAK